MTQPQNGAEPAVSRGDLRVAVLGTGTLGAPIARNLAGSGIQVAAWNRSIARAEPLTDSGVRVCSAVSDAVHQADIVLTMLSDASAVSEVMQQAGGLQAMRPGTIWVQSSTVGITDTARYDELAGKADVIFVDAPVLGTRTPAEKGQLVLLAAGPDRAHEPCRPVFEAIGKQTLWLGPAGHGTRLKLVANTWLLSLVEVLAEAVSFTQAVGLEPETFFSTIEQAGVSLPYVRLKGGAMVREEFPPDFTLRLARKDLRLVLDAAAESGLPLPIVETAVRQFDRAIELGHGEKDYAAAYLASRSRP